MTRWQKYLLENVYGGKKPISKVALERFELLGHVKDEVIVHFPDFNGIGGFKPAHVETYVVTFDEDDVPNGKISAMTLAANLELWLSRGYEVSTRGCA